MKLFGHRGDVQCRRAVELITDYLEDARPPAQRRRLDKHLAGYPHCAEYLAQIRGTLLAVLSASRTPTGDQPSGGGACDGAQGRARHFQREGCQKSAHTTALGMPVIQSSADTHNESRLAA
jgi:hypothetical protein